MLVVTSNLGNLEMMGMALRSADSAFAGLNRLPSEVKAR